MRPAHERARALRSHHLFPKVSHRLPTSIFRETIQQMEKDRDLMKSDLKKQRDDADQWQAQTEKNAEYITVMEEKVYRSNKISLELLKQLKDAETEIQNLQDYIVELKQRMAVYIPQQNDALDKTLAEFINNFPDRSQLRICFLRESEGVYQFGSRRVNIKVEQGLLKVRVGGGYLSIEEFLEQYTPQELEKQNRKDSIKRFNQSTAIQQALEAHAAQT